MAYKAYKLMKRIIARGGYDKSATMDKLDVFLTADRLSPEEYQELVGMVKKEDEGDGK